MSRQSTISYGRLSRPRSTNFATSQHEMMLTPIPSSTPASNILRWSSGRRGFPCTHQTHTWVSSKITAQRPNHHRRPDRWDGRILLEHLAMEIRNLAGAQVLRQRLVRLLCQQETAVLLGELHHVHPL